MNQKKTDKNPRKRRQGRGSYYFLGTVCAAYLGILIIAPDTAAHALIRSGRLCIRLLPVFGVVILFMGIVNYLVTPRMVSKHLGIRAGCRGWFLALATGVLSHGSVYIWFPFLKDLRSQGMSGALTAVFLYSRAVKIPLLPVMAYYFGILYTAVLQCWLLAAALALGKLIQLTVDAPVPRDGS